jgi:hypothetical protein
MSQPTPTHLIDRACALPACPTECRGTRVLLYLFTPPPPLPPHYSLIGRACSPLVATAMIRCVSHHCCSITSSAAQPPSHRHSISRLSVPPLAYHCSILTSTHATPCSLLLTRTPQMSSKGFDRRLKDGMND